MPDIKPGPRLLRRHEVERKTGLSASKLYGMIGSGRERDRDPDFPRPVPLGVRSVAWLESEIDAWIERQVARRNDPRPKKPIKRPRACPILGAVEDADETGLIDALHATERDR